MRGRRGWCLTKQHAALTESDDTQRAHAKKVTMRFILDHIVPEAIGLKASATAGAALLYELDGSVLAA